jgi:hypothetical protein
MKAYQFAGPEVLAVWDEVLPLVEQGLSPGFGEKSPEDLLEAIREGLSQLFLWRDRSGVVAVLVTSIITYPQYKVVFIDALAGKNILSIIRDYRETFCIWAAANGAVAIEGATRPAMTRLLKKTNARKVYDIVRYSLERPHELCS